MLYPLSYEGLQRDRSRSAGGPGRRGRLRLVCQRARGSRWFRGWPASTVPPARAVRRQPALDECRTVI